MRPTQVEPGWASDATPLAIGTCLWLILNAVATGSGTSFRAFDGLILLFVLACAAGLGSGDTETPSIREPWYQYEGCLRGL